jgi:Tfp pilus assembly protein PilV
MKFASIGTRARSWLLPANRNRGRAGYMLLEALVSLALVLAFAGVLGPVLFQARRIMSGAGDRIAAQALLRSLLDAPLHRAEFAKSAREGETAGLHWRVTTTLLHTDKPSPQRANSATGQQGGTASGQLRESWTAYQLVASVSWGDDHTIAAETVRLGRVQ